MNGLESRTEDQFKPLLGKRVEVTDSKGERRVGILQFAGVNELLHGEFQVTLSRCPIWPVKRETVKLFETND